MSGRDGEHAWEMQKALVGTGADGLERMFYFKNEGEDLAATLHRPAPAPPGGAPAVLMCHGLRGNRIEAHCLFVKAARALAEAGIAALRFDCRGSGESQGRFQDMSILTELADAKAALNTLRMTAGVDPERLGVLGLSMGGAVAALLTGARREVRSAALWSAVGHFAERIREKLSAEAAEALGSQGFYEQDGYAFGPRFAQDAAKVAPLEAIARSRAPVLLVHGTADETVPPGEARAYEAALAARDEGRVEVLLIQDADHTYTGMRYEEQVIARTVTWFTETL